MDFSLSPEQVSFRNSIVEFARKELNHDIMENDEKHKNPQDDLSSIYWPDRQECNAYQQYGQKDDFQTLSRGRV